MMISDEEEDKPAGHVNTGAVVAGELLFRAAGQLEDGCVRGGEGARPAVVCNKGDDDAHDDDGDGEKKEA